LRDGELAGLEAYQVVEEEIHASGYGDKSLGKNVRQKIIEIERSIDKPG